MPLETYMLDTNTVIHLFKGQGRVSDTEAVTLRLRLLALPPRSIGIPSIVVYELKVGIAKSQSPEKRRGQLQKLLEAVTFYTFGQDEADAAASIRAGLEKRGTPIGAYDVLIAAVALANHATLVTRNQDEFSRVPGLKLLDWY